MVFYNWKKLLISTNFVSINYDWACDVLNEGGIFDIKIWYGQDKNIMSIATILHKKENIPTYTLLIPLYHLLWKYQIECIW